MSKANPEVTYETILEQLANGELTDLQRQIFKLLKENPNGLDRYQLVFKIYGYLPVKIEGNTDDRKIRFAIQALRKRLFPIVSTSGRPGYRLDVSREAVQKMIRELRSRRDRIDEQITAASKFYDLPVVYTEPVTATQKELAL